MFPQQFISFRKKKKTIEKKAASGGTMTKKRSLSHYRKGVVQTVPRFSGAGGANL